MARRSEQLLRRENARLRRENAQLRARCGELERLLGQLEEEKTRLKAELEARRREGKRQAAPFSKGPPQPHPKRPGRKPGAAYGKKAFRPPPRPEQIDEVYEAPLPEACPHCGGAVEESHVADQYQVELPRRPIYRQFHVHVGHCAECGKRIQGRHPLQTSDALGAAASQLGPAAQAALAFLNKHAGLSHGKIVRVFQELLGISLTRGGSIQAVMRAGRRLRPVYQELAQAARDSPWAVPDETGWRVEGRSAWLHVVVGEQTTCFVIAPGRSAEATAEILGWDYAGVLIHDGYSTYDRFAQAQHQQCLRHVLNRAQEMLKTARGGAVRFPRQVIALLQQALAAREAFREGQLSEDELAERCLRLAVTLEEMTERPKQNPENAQLAKHLRRHMWAWFWFLLEPGIDATNYRAEQALRLGVVNRKVWGGNRTWTGARAQETLMSVLATCQRHLVGAIDYLAAALCGSPPPLPPPAKAET